eukprot:c10141_g1_i1.p1 GENE.c10141_g1_i1~~c10141_g1_i1.p1  ORF type:complete len:295 (+),score=113.16 c10141_g1_i1:22-885(+)
MKIAILKCMGLDEQIHIEGPYEDMFKNLYCSVDPTIVCVTFDCYTKKRSLPKPTEIDQFDAFLVTGSPQGAYDQSEWIFELQDFIVKLFRLQKPLIGICFGHQLIAQALDGEVRKADCLYNLGMDTYQVDIDALVSKNIDISWLNPKLKTISACVSHGDQVFKIPQSATVFLSSPICPIAGYIIDERVLSFQCHPEFSKRVINFMLDYDTGVALAAREKGRKTMDIVSDDKIFAEWTINWLKMGKEKQLLKKPTSTSTSTTYVSSFLWIVIGVGLGLLAGKVLKIRK